MKNDNQIMQKPKCSFCDNYGFAFVHGRLICGECLAKLYKKQEAFIMEELKSGD